MNKNQRKIFAEKFLDLANLILVTLSIGSLIALKKINWYIIFLGILLYIILSVISYLLSRDGGEN
jgi:hypothetical protein